MHTSSLQPSPNINNPLQYDGTLMNSTDKILILLVEGFDEGEAGMAVSELREAGLPVKVVGHARQPVRGAHGLLVQPDLSLDQVLLKNHADATNLIIIGGRGWSYRLSKDPRIRRLVDAIVQKGRSIFLSETASEWPMSWMETPAHLIRRYNPDHQLRQTMRELCWDLK
jgi:hypothetical protein